MVHHSLCHTLHFIAQNKGIAARGIHPKIGQQLGIAALLDGHHFIALTPESIDGFEGIGKVPPRHGIFSPEGGFVNFGMRRRSGDAAEPNGFQTEGIGRAQHAPYVVEAAHVVEHHDEREFRGFLKGRHIEPPHFFDIEFEMVHRERKFFRKGRKASEVRVDAENHRSVFCIYPKPYRAVRVGK